jgi:TonB-dependent Receptor Plug Domain.
VVIRGLSPKYNTVTVNGIRLPSTDTQNRSVDLSLVSSNMLDGIAVTKAVTPDQDADALGGSIDLKLRTAEPEWRADLMYQGGYNRLQDTYDNYKLNASVSRRVWGERIGIIANVNADSYNRSADRFNASYGDVLVGEERRPFPNQLDLQENALRRERLGGSAVVDVKLPAGKIVFNTIYNRLTNDGQVRTNIMNFSSDEQRYRLSDNYNESYINATGLSVEQDFEWMSFDASASLNRSENHSPGNTSYTFLQQYASDQTYLREELTPVLFPSIFSPDSMATFMFDMGRSSRITNEEEHAAQFNLKCRSGSETR